MCVVRRRLEAPRELAGIRIERHDADRPRVVAGTRAAVEHRRRIAGADVDEVEVGIVGPGHPHLAAHRLARLRLARLAGRIEGPLQVAVLRIERLQDTRQIVEVARHPHEQVVLHQQRRVGRPIALAGVGDLDPPFHRAVRRVQRHQIAVGRRQVDQVLVDGDAAMPDVEGLVVRIGVGPQLASAARVDRPHVVRRRHVHHAVDEDRARLDLIVPPGLEDPGESQVLDVLGRDLRERTVAPPAVVAVVGRPAVLRRLEQRRRVQALGDQCGDRECGRQRRGQQPPT